MRIQIGGCSASSNNPTSEIPHHLSGHYFDGTLFPDTSAALHAIGQPEEAYWPYSAQPLPRKKWVLPAKPAVIWKCSTTTCFSDISRVRKQIDDSAPAVIGLYISDTFNTPHTWDKIESEFVLGMDNGQGIDPDSRHAAVVVGRGTYSGVPVYLLRNSWGRDWGNDGHAWVREEYLKLRIYDGFIIS